MMLRMLQMCTFETVFAMATWYEDGVAGRIHANAALRHSFNDHGPGWMYGWFGLLLFELGLCWMYVKV